MSEPIEAPPGLEALANHLGYTFVKKEPSSETASNSDAQDKPADGSSASEEQADAKEEAKSEPEPEKAKVPKGSLSSSGNIYWDNQNETWTAEEPKDTKPAENEDTEVHAVLIRLMKSKDSRKKYEIDSLIIQSPQLKVALGEVLEDYPGVCCNLDRLVFDKPFEPFVHRWGRFLEYMQKDGLDSITKDHLNVLHEILRKELADVIKAFDDYVSNGMVTYEHAWIVYQPGAVIVTVSASHAVALKLVSGSYLSTPDDGDIYRLHCERVDWNGRSFGWATEYVQVPSFKGIKPIHELCAFPLSFHPLKENVKHALIERGKKFAELAGVHYQSYDGAAVMRTRDGNVLVQTSGRIMIDAGSFCKQWDQCNIYISPLNSDSSSEDMEPDWENPVTTDTSELSIKEQPATVDTKLTDFQHMLCTPLLRGYSLKSKKWLSFFVPHVDNIKWDSNAFDRLVLPPSQKRIILALSKTQVSTTATTFDDMISGKGKGMILLLSGPPGVGKTLTAEAVSESMKVPLFLMSAGDLGVRPDEVEMNLQNVLEMVAKWRAILLIDECDVFLEARSVHDLDRNKLVSIFLRLLEYYQGTLFLTTNRAGNIDPAFGSRIHVHMAYRELSAVSRKSIWRSFLGEVASGVSDAEIEDLALRPLNGRQIKNMVKTAQLLALEEKRVLAKEHVDVVMAIERGFAFEEE